MPWIIAHKTLLYIDHEIATAIAEPKLMPVEAVVDFLIDIIFSLIDDLRMMINLILFYGYWEMKLIISKKSKTFVITGSLV